jgi:hypothetical protein
MLRYRSPSKAATRPLGAKSGRDDSGTDDCAGGIAGLVSPKSASLVFAKSETLAAVGA